MIQVELTNHAKYRLMERNVDVHHAKRVAKEGSIFKIQEDGTIVKVSTLNSGKKLFVVLFKDRNKLVIKTAYYEN